MRRSVPARQTGFDQPYPAAGTTRSLSFERFGERSGETSGKHGIRIVLKVGILRSEQVRLTILEMLDLLEAAMLGKRAQGRPARDVQPSSMTPADLRSELAASELSEAEFAATFGVEPETLEQWLAGAAAIPGWFERSISLYELLTPAARRKLLNRPKPDAARPRTVAPSTVVHPLVQAAAPPARNRPARSANHPFSRIDEL